MAKSPFVFTDILMHERRLNAHTRDLSIEELELAIEKLQNVVKTRHEEQREQEERLARKAEKMREIEAALSEYEISPNEFAEHLVGQKVKKIRKQVARKKPKYRFKDEEGKTQTWSGNGRRPTALVKLLEESGRPLDDFLIQPKNTDE